MAPELEGKHGKIHSFIGWTMYRGSPASDPIFWLHHSFIDLILERWIRIVSARGLLSLEVIMPCTIIQSIMLI
jgi:tyrosinase